MTGRIRNEEIDVMNTLVEAYEKVADEKAWAQVRDMCMIYPQTKATMYKHIERTIHLWEKKKKGAVVYMRPIAGWRNQISNSEEEYYFAQDSFVLFGDMLKALTSIHAETTRLSKLNEIMQFKNAQEDYKGAYSDYKAKLKTIKKLIKELEE